MDIDFLRGQRDRRKREKDEIYRTMWVRHDERLLKIYEYLKHVFSKTCCLSVHCTPEQLPAVLFSLRTVLDLPYVEFQHFERRVPGPIFCGSREALEWMAKGFKAAHIPCRVRRVGAFPFHVLKGTEIFHYPVAQNLSVADAYKDSHEIYLIFLDQIKLERDSRFKPLG